MSGYCKDCGNQHCTCGMKKCRHNYANTFEDCNADSKGRCDIDKKKCDAPHSLIRDMEWRTDFENTKKGVFLVSYKGKTYFAVKFDKRYKKCNIYNEKTDFFIRDISFESIDAWMPMPEGVKK